MVYSIPIPTAIELIEQVRRIYAENLGIPLDKVTVEADLVADLGVDSLTQDELMVQILERYGIPDKANMVQSMSYPTIGDIAGVILSLLSEENGGENS